VEEANYVAGVIADGPDGVPGVIGFSDNNIGTEGIRGKTSGLVHEPAGVIGDSTINTGVIGASSFDAGVWGKTSANNYARVAGNDESSGGGFGVTGSSTVGEGVVGLSTDYIAVRGTNGSGSGLWGENIAGVIGDSPAGISGIIGLSENNNGVVGISGGSSGLFEQQAGVVYDSNAKTGVIGASSVDDSVDGFTSAHGRSDVSGMGQNTGSVGVTGSSTHGHGIAITGGLAPLLLTPASTAGAPVTGAHSRGELYTDTNGALFCCVVSGTAGTWVQVAAAPTGFASGASCLLSAPIRLLDTRPGATAPTRPGTPVTAGGTIVAPITGEVVGGISVRAGAVAVIGNVTAVDAVGRGYLTLWAEGVAQPGTSSINFPATTAVANRVTVALSAVGGDAKASLNGGRKSDGTGR
jgi:hypothetical protein